MSVVRNILIAVPGEKRKLAPLSVTHPEIAAQADGWDPSKMFAGSSKKVSWVCPKGHHFETRISHRTSGKSICPVCSNRQVLNGVNDLASQFPKIAEEAEGWDPRSVLSGTHSKLAWKCPNGHSYKAIVVSRTLNNTACPFCANKKLLVGFNDLETTNPKVAKEAYGWDPKTVFAGSPTKKNWLCPDGHSYTASISSRTRSQASGCPICTNKVNVPGVNDLETLFPEIAAEAEGWDPTEFVSGSNRKMKWKCPNGHIYLAPVASRTSRNSGCNVCNNHEVVKGFNDLATTRPDLALEADGWDPTEFVAGSSSKKKWKCPLGHSYFSVISSRAGNQKTLCPVCAHKKLLPGFNDLATTHPFIASQASGWDPRTVFAGSGAKRKWKCDEGHFYTSRLDKRTGRGSGCPTCAVTGFDPNSDGFLYFIAHSKWNMFQIGITNVPDDRLARHKKLGWKVLELRGPMDGYLTQQWETAILRMLKAKGADLSNEKIAGKFDGYSEAWSKSTFEVKSIKELMQLTEEFESK